MTLTPKQRAAFENRAANAVPLEESVSAASNIFTWTRTMYFARPSRKLRWKSERQMTMHGSSRETSVASLILVSKRLE